MMAEFGSYVALDIRDVFRLGCSMFSERQVNPGLVGGLKPS